MQHEHRLATDGRRSEPHFDPEAAVVQPTKKHLDAWYLKRLSHANLIQPEYRKLDKESTDELHPVRGGEKR